MNGLVEKSIDVLGLGCTAVDDLLYVPFFPEKDAKVRVQSSARRLGGLTGVALITAARLGGKTAFAGCLGTDTFSEYVAEQFTKEGIDVSQAPRLSGGRVVRSTILVAEDDGSRNVFYQVDGLIGAHENLPREDVILSSRVLFIDHYGMAGNLRAVRLARTTGTAIVADFEDATVPLFEQVLPLVNHLILSESFAKVITRKPNARTAAQALWHSERETVVVTCGAEGCWSVSSDNSKEPKPHAAFSIEAKDTTGCGDVFHGAYALSLARGYDLDYRIRFASAAAALKAESNEIPDIQLLRRFLETAESGCRHGK